MARNATFIYVAPMKTHKKLFLFDFDGTICDSFGPFIDILNEISFLEGYKQINPEAKDFYRSQSTRKTLIDIGVPMVRFPFLVQQVRREVEERIHGFHPISGAIEAIKDLKSQGIEMGIVTSNSVENVAQLLEKWGVRDHFKFIYSEVSLFGKGQIIKKACEQAGISNRNQSVYYIGDEIRDIEAAKDANVQSIAVSWGFNSQELLAKGRPNHLIHRVEELSDLIIELEATAIEQPVEEMSYFKELFNKGIANLNSIRKKVQ